VEVFFFARSNLFPHSSLLPLPRNEREKEEELFSCSSLREEMEEDEEEDENTILISSRRSLIFFILRNASFNYKHLFSVVIVSYYRHHHLHPESRRRRRHHLIYILFPSFLLRIHIEEDKTKSQRQGMREDSDNDTGTPTTRTSIGITKCRNPYTSPSKPTTTTKHCEKNDGANTSKNTRPGADQRSNPSLFFKNTFFMHRHSMTAENFFPRSSPDFANDFCLHIF
jgi:hypothetical protein